MIYFTLQRFDGVSVAVSVTLCAVAGVPRNRECNILEHREVFQGI